MSENVAKRPWLAAILALVYPGLGHLYLGLWMRAFLWSGTAALTATLFVPEEAVALAREEGLATLGASLTGETVFMLVAVTVLAAADAYWRASKPTAPDGGDGRTCPECGKEADVDLTFCQWCTVEFDDASPG